MKSLQAAASRRVQPWRDRAILAILLHRMILDDPARDSATRLACVRHSMQDLRRLRANYWVRVQLQPAADGDIKLIWKMAVAPDSTSSDPEMDSEFVPETVSTPDPLFVI